MGHRRKARENALQGLYMYEIGQTPLEKIISLEWTEKPVSGDIREFTVMLIEGTVSNINRIDSYIKKYSKNWEFERLSAIDKSILRMALYEILYVDDIPDIVSINEGIELGKIYGGENSSQFINGILDSVHKSLLTKEKKVSSGNKK